MTFKTKHHNAYQTNACGTKMLHDELQTDILVTTTNKTKEMGIICAT